MSLKEKDINKQKDIAGSHMGGASKDKRSQLRKYKSCLKDF